MTDLDDLREIRDRHAEWNLLVTTHPRTDYICASPAHDRAVLLSMVERYRQTFLDIATASGDDTSDLTHPDQLVTPSIDELALAEVRRLHADYLEALGEV